MSRYRKYTDNYLAILGGLRLTENLGGRPLIDTRECTRTEYNHVISADKYRATVVELRDPQQYNAATTLDTLYDPANYDTYPRYGQGEYDAAVFYWITNLHPDLKKIYQEMSDETLKTYFAFPYIDDQGTPCALSVMRFGHDPTAQFSITHIHNTHAPYEDRIVTFICHNAIMKTDYYAGMHGAHNERIIDENSIMRHVRAEIRSDRVSNLLSSLFTQEGTITEENFGKLKSRIRHHNVDNRDTLTHQIPRLIHIASKINPQVATQIQDTYAFNFVDFFKGNNYGKLLSDLIRDTHEKHPNKLEAMSELQDLYLEFLVIQLYYEESNARSAFIASGISVQQTLDLFNQFQTIIPKVRKNTAFSEKINQLYRKTHYSWLITRLEHAIHDSAMPLVRDNAKNELAWIRNLNDTFFSLKPSKQKTAIAFVEKLLEFTSTPNDIFYRDLRKLYPKVRLDPATLDHLKLNLEIMRFNQNIILLKQNLKSCPHPYMRRELAKNVPFIKGILPTFSTRSLEEQMFLNQFLENLNNLSKNKAEIALKSIEQDYRKLSLPPITAEERTQLLLPSNIARMQHEIDQEHYILDTQGRILVTTFDSEQSGQPVLWSIDPATSHHPDLSARFNEMLSNILQTQQTSAVMTGKILELFEKNKTQIFSVQQSLQVFLDQVAQAYQNNMSPTVPLITDEMRQEAVFTTLQRLNRSILQILAQGLAQNCINIRGNVVPKMNPEKLNTFLIEEQDQLRQQGKAILIESLRAQIQQSDSIENFKSTSKPLICFNITQSLATEIITTAVEPEYSCRQLKTFHCSPPDFIPSKETKAVRIQSNALSTPEDGATIDYQNQFNQRLTQIAQTYGLREGTPATYYLYDASPEQIQQTLAVLHGFNGRPQRQETLQTPLCLLQIYNLADSSIQLGYPLFSNSTSEITLMFEMTLCQQIARFDYKDKIDLSHYRTFLNPEPSLFGDLFRSSLFVSSSEGQQTRKQIATLKTAWQQEANTETQPSTQVSAAKALQKLLAFDLHFDPTYALLIQALSLAIQETSILNDESVAQTQRSAIVLTLGHAQIFDLITLPTTIQVPLNTLLQASDKSTAIQGANLLIEAMQDYVKQHQNGATLLTIYQQASDAAQEATSPADIARTHDHLQTPIAVTSRNISTDQPNSPLPRRRRMPPPVTEEKSSTSFTRHHGFFREESSRKNPASILDKAGRNKADAFKRRGPGGTGSSDN